MSQAVCGDRKTGLANAGSANLRRTESSCEGFRIFTNVMYCYGISKQIICRHLSSVRPSSILLWSVPTPEVSVIELSLSASFCDHPGIGRL